MVLISRAKSNETHKETSTRDSTPIIASWYQAIECLITKYFLDYLSYWDYETTSNKIFGEESPPAIVSLPSKELPICKARHVVLCFKPPHVMSCVLVTHHFVLPCVFCDKIVTFVLFPQKSNQKFWPPLHFELHIKCRCVKIHSGCEYYALCACDVKP